MLPPSVRVRCGGGWMRVGMVVAAPTIGAMNDLNPEIEESHPQNPLPDAFKVLCLDNGAEERLGALIEMARDEDLGGDIEGGDATSAVLPDPDREITARVVHRTGGPLAGLVLGPMICEAFGGRVEFSTQTHDGVVAGRGAVIAELKGPISGVLTVERTLLNFLGRLCGVAERTRAFVERIDLAGRAFVFDTRKTTPGWRGLEKYAVRCGGGRSHRLGLHDALLIKDNHIAGVAPEQLGERVRTMAAKAREAYGEKLQFVMVEVDTLDQLRAVLKGASKAIDLVLLDNMPPPMLREAVELRDKLGVKVELEASGGVTLESVGEISRTGVERISVGSLTHGAWWSDIGLDITDERTWDDRG